MTDKTLYVVSGFMRTGTSMMMKALKAGGLNACYAESRDNMKDNFTDKFYDPNSGGLYELEKKDYNKPDFPRGYESKLIKGLNKCIPKMNVMPDGIRTVFMRRDAEEIRQSYDAFFGKQINPNNFEVSTRPSTDHIPSVIANNPSFRYTYLDKTMGNIIECIKNRKDILSLDVFWYREVLDDPVKYFEILKEHGWDIDVDKASEVVDPEYCRYKLEELGQIT